MNTQVIGEALLAQSMDAYMDMLTKNGKSNLKVSRETFRAQATDKWNTAVHACVDAIVNKFQKVVLASKTPVISFVFRMDEFIKVNKDNMQSMSRAIAVGLRQKGFNVERTNHAWWIFWVVRFNTYVRFQITMNENFPSLY